MTLLFSKFDFISCIIKSGFCVLNDIDFLFGPFYTGKSFYFFGIKII